MEQFNIKHVKFNLRNNKSHEAAAVSLEKLIFTNAKKDKDQQCSTCTAVQYKPLFSMYR